MERQSFMCDGTPLDLDLLKVYNPPDHAVRGPCTGVIRRLEIDTWTEDGLKMGSKTHDLQVLGGYIRCHDRAPVVHQDGIHDMGSSNVLIKNVEVTCFTSNHSALFINQGTKSPKPPENVICDGCILRTRPNAIASNNTVHIANAVNSGVRNSRIYDDAIRGDSPTLVNENNVFFPNPGTTTWGRPCRDGCRALTDRH